jgi:hypothetical protein
LIAGEIGVQRRIVLYAAAVESDSAEIGQLHLPTSGEELPEERLKRRRVLFAEVADGAEVGLLVGGKEPKGDVAFQQSGELARASDAVTVPENEDLQEQSRLVGGVAPAALVVWLVERIEPALGVELVDEIRDEHFEAVVLDSVVERFRHEVLLVLIVWKEVVAHGRYLPNGDPELLLTR